MHNTVPNQASMHHVNGFLLVELLLALFMLMATISGVAVYQAHTYALCAHAKKRDEALTIASSVIETLHATRQRVDSTTMSDVVVTVKPMSFGSYHLPDASWSAGDEVMLVDVETSWQLTSGARTSFHTITCVCAGEQ